MISCGEAVRRSVRRRARARAARHRAGRRRVRVRRRSAARGRRRSHRRLSRLLGHRTRRSARGAAAIVAACSTACARRRASRRPDVFVAIDFPDFNFRLLPSMKALGVPIVYYVSPQLWAWRPRRLETIRRYVDRMLVIFPFEAAIYEQAGVPVEFVGHPLVDLAARDAAARRRFCARRDSIPAARCSRSCPAAGRTSCASSCPCWPRPRRSSARGVAGRPVPGRARAVARRRALRAGGGACAPPGLSVRVAVEATDDVLAASDVVVTASGTATVQAALHGTADGRSSIGCRR